MLAFLVAVILSVYISIFQAKISFEFEDNCDDCDDFILQGLEMISILLL